MAGTAGAGAGTSGAAGGVGGVPGLMGSASLIVPNFGSSHLGHCLGERTAAGSRQPVDAPENNVAKDGCTRFSKDFSSMKLEINST